MTKLPGKKTDQKKKAVKENGHVELFSSDEDENDDDIKFDIDNLNEEEELLKQKKYNLPKFCTLSYQF